MTNEEAVKIFEERLAFGEKEYSSVAKDYIEAIKTAISALRAQEKEPCEYCKVLTPDMCCGFTLPSIHGDEDGDVVTITHCPMCGRPLKGENI